MKSWISLFGSLLVFSLMTHTAQAGDQWQLDNSSSSVNLVSVKKGSVGEVFRFTALDGHIADGKAQLRIDLSSIDSGVDIRNERMRRHLFETARFASASASMAVQAAWLTLKTGNYLDVNTSLRLSLHGLTQSLPCSLRIVAVDDGLLVSTLTPVLIKAADFGMDKGIETLRQLAKLPAIATVVPVQVQLHFVRPAQS